jgi:HEPN domain-containing protein
MIPVSDLRKIARARLRDSEVLAKARRYDGGLYLCGYAVEIALKARICRTLKWVAFPDSDAEFRGLTSLKTHSLDLLLRLSGVEGKIKRGFFAEWSTVAKWDPASRYRLSRSTGVSAKRADLQLMIASAKKLLKEL